jgi:hypothetical protein
VRRRGVQQAIPGRADRAARRYTAAMERQPPEEPARRRSRKPPAPETRAKLAAAMRRRWASTGERARLSQAIATTWADGGYRANRDAARARRRAERPAPRKPTPEERFARWPASEARLDGPLPATWLPRHKERSCAAEDAWLLAHADLPAFQAATILGRSEMAVWQRRSGLRRWWDTPFG